MTGQAGDAACGSEFAIPEDLRGDHDARADALYDAAGSIGSFDGGGLPARIREIVAVAVLAHMGFGGIEAHMRRAVAAGATVREIAEALMVASTPGGQRCLAFGLPHLSKLVEELGEPALAAPDNPSTARTRRGLSRSGDWPWLDERFADYQRYRREMSRLSFVPQNAALETKYREMLAAVVLSCRRYFTVQEHVDRAIEEGASLDELVDAYRVGSLFGGASVFSHGLAFLTRTRDAIEAGTLAPR